MRLGERAFGFFAPGCVFALGLLGCGDTERSAAKHAADPAVGGAGDGGESASGGAGGGVAGTPGGGGSSTPPDGGAAGDPGAGGMPAGGSGGTVGGGGSGGAGAGAAGNPNTAGSGGGGCEPAPVCGDLGPCDAGWDASCGPDDSPSCCDAESGIIKDCVYDGGGTHTEEFVAIDSCTLHSFGTEPCAGCVIPTDPHCDSNWASGGCTPKVYCSHPELGFRQSCESDASSSYLRVECVCDPDA